jgi:hypothetical protein
VDLAGVLAGDEEAIEDASRALEEVLSPYAQADCRAGVVLVFGHGATIGQGIQLATVITGEIDDLAPEVFGGAAFDNFGDLTPPLGQVDIRIYFFSGCVPAEQ